PSHVDAADGHALGDLVLLGRVVGVGAHRAQQQDDDTGDDRDFRLSSQQRSSTGPGRGLGSLSKILGIRIIRPVGDLPLQSRLRCRGHGGYLSAVRSKDEVRKEVWAAMDREGVSRFPGAEGRIPNFAGARLAAEKLAVHRLWKRARTIKANP